MVFQRSVKISTAFLLRVILSSLTLAVVNVWGQLSVQHECVLPLLMSQDLEAMQLSKLAHINLSWRLDMLDVVRTRVPPHRKQALIGCGPVTSAGSALLHDMSSFPSFSWGGKLALLIPLIPSPLPCAVFCQRPVSRTSLRAYRLLNQIFFIYFVNKSCLGV